VFLLLRWWEMKPENLERAASEDDEIIRLRPLLDRLLAAAKLPADQLAVTLTYSLLFSTHQNLDGMLQCLRQRHQKRLLRFIQHKAFLSKLAEIASKLFDPRFVHNRVMKSAIDRLDFVRKLQVEPKEVSKKVHKEKVEECFAAATSEEHELVEEKNIEKTTQQKEVVPRTVKSQQKTRKAATEKKVMQKTNKKKGITPRTADSQRTFRKTRESQV
jgi:hypothetical protein